ncbi:MAG: hypothetical protein WAR79_20245 [Melioribacteraceae bacterium]
MKKMESLIVLLLFFFIGCQENNSILEPTDNDTQYALDKSRPILGTTTEKLAFNYDSDAKTFSVVSKNFTVDGKKGDVLFISETYLKDGKLISMNAKLTIPQNAFKGTLNFDMVFDFDNYSIQLYPTPFTFDKPVILDLTFLGVDFSTIDPAKLVFNYLDGEKLALKYTSVNINDKWKILSVVGVQIPHFSRYGWTRTTN